ncbi:MAG: hypothetical protein A3F31_04910 [Candidatus Levybacteria bacterium RIFCSPHIGHO2_12_FULL_38_12]|nr:MAG: hypothetical protein A2770_04595 [Candidatus Levybacteria bacterium RIFCSPHIGHO2_01_FULL_38_12]OGH21750.1 MAG: hypothetical protein A3D75_00995 [Candidatus Levybacteria bacterium RIFCSPHIGHO2_02_FULL_37_18]OGH22592.1 MAG: hypothetical protein A3F31_04910 [Candidatus Levybacteria bacterium RIFCSPHIGHO2_12_FULL_38_12]OGH33371.1 MAG: hypothetical protein A3A47_03945 [Candidatus Levybacteria bacterium RIFCSPLOWO2_01_FULL_37_20]OGH44130.1 MAG: hypothetical protein A3J14_05280 [Candidatus Lev
MQHESVKKLFKEQVRHYSHKDQYKHSPLTQLILECLKNKKTNKKIEICEFGGGAGQLLNEIGKVYPKANLTNVEIIDDYKSFLTSKKVRFVNSSVLNSNFSDGSFDVIIMRDVLHHLVGRNYKETLYNQTLALRELKRLVRPGGVIFIEELTNESEVATRIIYYLSRLNFKIGLSIPSLFVISYVIVAFLTSTKLLNLSSSVFGEKNIKTQMLAVETKWYFQIVHLFSGLKKVILVVKK